jgi:tetratricopeptide (TPR) repeat protein
MSMQQFILSVIAVAALAVAILMRFYRPRPRWKLVSVKGDFTREHHLPEVLPVPATEEARVAAGEFSFDEAVGWMKSFVASRRRHPFRVEFQLAIRKADFYKQLIDRMGRGKWGEVDEVAARLAELDPLDPSAALARGRAMREMGQLASAVQFYQQALKLQPTHSLALPEFAATCRAIGQPDRFRDALDRARRKLGETHPLTIESRVQLGELVRVFADPSDPATIAHIPRQQYVQNMRMRLEAMPLELHDALPLGRSMLEDDMPELAEAVVERFEGTFGDCAEVMGLRGMIQRRERDLVTAEQSLRHALELDDQPIVRLELARVLLDSAAAARVPADREGLVQEAEQQLRLAIDRDPDSAEAIALLAERAQKRGIGKVVEIIEPIARAYPRAWAPWRVLGDAYAAEEMWPDALTAYELGLSRERSDALVMAHLGVLHAMDDNAQLVEALERIDDLDQRDHALRWRVAQLYCELHRFDAASRILTDLVEDEEAPPMLRQRAREALQQLENPPGDDIQPHLDDA